MKVEKKVIGKLDKCYSIAPLRYHGKEHILVAAEKDDRCILFDSDGNEVDTVWTKPGGAMTMVQVPGTDGQFLSTHRFYSPNDSKDAEIVIVTPVSRGNWEVRTLVKLPHVHRFDIISQGEVHYLIACTLKSGHEYKEDWSMPGKVYAALLPDDLSGFNREHQLELLEIKGNLLKNHGYFRIEEDEVQTCLISSEDGVFLFSPPDRVGEKWKIIQLLDVPTSDAVMLDLDGDGEKEIVLINSFHGKQISIYKKQQKTYEKVYDYECVTEFSHGIFGGRLCGKPTVVIGHRQGRRRLIAFTWDENSLSYQAQVLDEDCGSANICKYRKGEKDIIISTNREIDEIAMYMLS